MFQLHGHSNARTTLRLWPPVDAVTFFYSTTFFTYTDSSPADSATAAYYNKGKTSLYYEKVKQALMKGERTDTFRTYQSLAKE